MITSTIGKTFLKAYNEKYGTTYDGRTFFMEKFYPLFFDQNKYMMTAGNSPLENPKISWNDMIHGKKEYETTSRRKERFEKLIEKIDSNVPDASIARGYPTIDICTTTSGQVSNLSLPTTEEDLYLSWVGDALGVGVLGGFSILFMKKEILLDIYTGWSFYRQVLNSNTKLKGNQINTWNAQWLSHYYDSKDFISGNPLANFNPYSSSNDGILSVDSQIWTKVLMGISVKYHDAKVLGYIYSIGQTNTTVGFIPFDLTGIRRPKQLYKKIFGEEDSRKAEDLWGTAYGFKAICAEGAIGLKAMEPKGLKAFVENKKPKVPKNDAETINNKVYKIWILAMLNNEDLWEKSQMFAQMLKEASHDKEKSVSTKRKNLVNNVLEATNKKQFVTAATEIAPFVVDMDEFKNVVKEIHGMPNDNVPYFLTLIRFQFNTI